MFYVCFMLIKQEQFSVQKSIDEDTFLFFYSFFKSIYAEESFLK